ncbi:MAG: hypothetical protein KKH98_12725 [Spirochaetes bacterium]|nr:hypothetical protein [Spirochaetota bacterium]
MHKYILFFFIILIPATLFSFELKKYYPGDKQQFHIKKIEDKVLDLSIERIDNPEALFLNTSLNSRPVPDGKKRITPTRTGRNLFNRLLNIVKKKKYYDYDINFDLLKTGFYLFRLKGTDFSKEVYILITKYRLITKILYDQGSSLLWDVSSGEPIKNYTLFLCNKSDKEKLNQSKKEDYFYSFTLNRDDYTLISYYSNCYDINRINEEDIIRKESFPYIEVLLPKEYFYLGENLSFISLLKIKDPPDYKNVLISTVILSIYDINNNCIKQKKIHNIDKGYTYGNFALDDDFKEGIYVIRVQWGSFVHQKMVIILKNYDPQLYFKIHSDDQIYYYNEKIIIDIETFYKYGKAFQNGSMQCDLLYKRVNSQDPYKYLITLLPDLKKGRAQLKVKVNRLLEKGDYFLKFIIKVTSNNGFEEADHYIVKVLQSDFSLSVKQDYNLFEIEKPLNIKYRIIPLKSSAVFKRMDFLLYKIQNIKEDTEKYILSRKLKKDQNNVTLKLNERGLYKARFILEDKQNHVISKEIYFWVLSYTYGIKSEEKLEDIIIVHDKNEYEYSDIGKILIIFPDKNFWYNIYIEGRETFYNEINFAEKNFILFDFPIYEKYSPEVRLKVLSSHNKKVYFKQINIKIPYVGKVLKLESQISNVNSKDKFNKISVETLNYWGHGASGYMLLYTLNKDFQELYNQSYRDYYLFSRLYGSIKDDSAILGYEFYSKTFHDKDIPYHSGFIYGNSLVSSFDHYDLVTFNKNEIKEKQIEYSRHGSWNSFLFGFTDDTKIGYKEIEHFYKRDYFINYYYPQYLSIKDKAYFALLIKNNKNVPNKFKFNFSILNGKYKTQLDKYVSVKSDAYQELLLSVQPRYQGAIKIITKNVSPTAIDKEEFLIKLRNDPVIEKKRNKFIKVKKDYYKLKYYLKGDDYYSKLKKPGLFCFYYDRGDDVVVRFRIRVKRGMRNIKIIDFIPSGCEYIDQNLKYHLYKIKSFTNYGITFKEGKVILHIPTLSKGVYNIYYILKAKYKGKYFLPGYTVSTEDKFLQTTPENDYVEIY